jgi:four helix bundle protein
MIGYKNLDVYKRSYKLAKDIHQLTQNFPSIEKHELGSQLRRAAVSITLNIAEGYGRKDSTGEFQHFLRNALGSCNEVRVIIELCKDLGYVEEETYRGLEEQYEIVGRQLYRLREANKS